MMLMKRCNTTRVNGQRHCYQERNWPVSTARRNTQTPGLSTTSINTPAHVGFSECSPTTRLAAALVDVVAVGTAQPTTTSPDTNAKDASSSDVFSWTAVWWPVCSVDSLPDPKVPVHIDLLGKSLVLWCDGQGVWRCHEDRCPHRLAPLSEGRVENGQLMCSYHGWTFDSQGACTSIPQIPKGTPAFTTACSSGRACVKVYPTQVKHGLLYVWPEAGSGAAEKAAATQPHWLSDEKRTPWYMRDLPVRYDTVMENLLDPSHVPYSHHGIAGNRYTAPTFEAMKGGEVHKDGFMVSRPNPSPDIHWKAPYHITYMGSFPVLQLLVIPTKPGWTRVFLNSSSVPMFVIPDRFRRFMFSAVLAFNNLFPGLHHMRSLSPIFDGDSYFLHVAERLVPPSKGLGLSTVIKDYYMPSPADAAIIGFRKWIDTFSGPVPTCRPEDEKHIPSLMPKEQVLDRWNQHTRHCPHCKKELARVEALLQVTRVAGFLLGVAAVAQVVSTLTFGSFGTLGATVAAATASSAGMPVWQVLHATGLHTSTLLCAVLSVLCIAGHSLLEKVREKFFFEDYVHATRD